MKKYLLIILIGLVIPSLVFATTQTFSYTGTVASWTIPATVTSIVIHLSGAGGGSLPAYTGGIGGASTGTLAVAAGTVYYYAVGQGGDYQNPCINAFPNAGKCAYSTGGGGGGMSWWSATSTFNTATVLIVAGGGGGDGTTDNGPNGGGPAGANKGGNGAGVGGDSVNGGGGGSGYDGGQAGTGGHYGYGGTGYASSSLTSTSTTDGLGAAAATNGSITVTYSTSSASSSIFSLSNGTLNVAQGTLTIN